MNFNQGCAKKVIYYPKSHFNQAEKLITVLLISLIPPHNFTFLPGKLRTGFTSPIAKSTSP